MYDGVSVNFVLALIVVIKDGQYGKTYIYYLLNNDMTPKEYAQEQMEISGKLMGENTDNGQLYEYHKGQFLAYRKVVDIKYR